MKWLENLRHSIYNNHNFRIECGLWVWPEEVEIASHFIDHNWPIGHRGQWPWTWPMTRHSNLVFGITAMDRLKAVYEFYKFISKNKTNSSSEQSSIVVSRPVNFNLFNINIGTNSGSSNEKNEKKSILSTINSSWISSSSKFIYVHVSIEFPFQIPIPNRFPFSKVELPFPSNHLHTRIMQKWKIINS